MSEPTTTPYALPDDLRRELYAVYRSNDDGLAAVFLMGVRMALDDPDMWRHELGFPDPVSLREARTEGYSLNIPPPTTWYCMDCARQFEATVKHFLVPRVMNHGYAGYLCVPCSDARTEKTNRDYIAAQLGTVKHLISQLPVDNVVTRLGLESRRDELEAELAGMAAAHTDAPSVPTGGA